MADKLRTQKKKFIALIEGALIKRLPVGDARRAAKSVYSAIRDELAGTIVLEPIEGIERSERRNTICETLRQAYEEKDPDKLRELLKQAYDYGQRMNERLLYYHKRAPFLDLEDDTSNPKFERRKAK